MENHSRALLGFRFKPTDHELVSGFLHRFLVEAPGLLPPPPHSTFMHKCNLFGNKFRPSQIWEDFGGADQPALYFFSELKKKTPKGSKVDRKMGLGGTWEGKSVPAWVEGTEGNSTCIGLKRTFWYKNEGSEDHRRWKLDEYSRFKSPRKRNSRHTCYDFDVVLCRLRNTSGINKRKCSTSSSQDDEVPKMMKCRANEEIEQNMHAINVEEEGRQANSCLTGNSVVSDHENNEFAVGDDVDYGSDDNDPRLFITRDELEEIYAREPFPTASATEEPLNPSFYRDFMFADGGVEEAYHPSAFDNVVHRSLFGSR